MSSLAIPTLPTPDRVKQPQPAHMEPLLSLSYPHILATCDTVRFHELWNCVTRSSHVIKDGSRMENLFWRQWARHRTSDASSLDSPVLDTPRSEHSFQFGTSLSVLFENDNLKDWVTEAKVESQRNVPVIQLPSTPPPASPPAPPPAAHPEIRLVEPTPAPSRVGSLGASVTGGGLLAAADIPSQVAEDDEPPAPIALPPARGARREKKFFFQSSPTKTASESGSPAPSPSELTMKTVEPAITSSPSRLSVSKSPRRSPGKQPSLSLDPGPSQSRRGSGSSSSNQARSTSAPKKKNRHVSLSTMRGRFAAEKRRAHAAMKAKKESAWEDEDEEETIAPRRRKAKSSTELYRRTPPDRATPPAPAPTPLHTLPKEQRVKESRERARILAALDVQYKRDLFAKQDIPGGNRPGGLLTSLLERGGSMVDLSAVSPTTGPYQSRTRLPSVTGPSLLRSKSAAALPVQSAVHATSVVGSSTLAQDQDLETDEEVEDNFLATSDTERRLDELSRRKSQPIATAQPALTDTGGPNIVNGVVQPMSPGTRRRQVIMREMSSSLRQNIILERQSSLVRIPSRTSIVSPTEAENSPRSRQNVLGNGILRPLTRTGALSSAGNPAISRTQSSAALDGTATAPVMERSTTADGVLRDERRRELARRSGVTDTSYRVHGW